MSDLLSDSGNERIRAGGNNPPPDKVEERDDFKAVAKTIEDLYEEAKHWADGQPIDSEPMHERVTALYDQIVEAGKSAEALRVTLKAPWDEGVAAVQEAFAPLLADTKKATGKVVRAKAALNTLLAAWRLKVREAAEKKAREAREEAERLANEARAAIQQSAGNIEERELAEARVETAKDAEKAASKAHKTATQGTGLRTLYKPVLLDLNAALGHYYAKGQSPHRARFEALVLELAGAEVRAGKRDGEDGTKAIPGFSIEPESKAT